MSTKVYIAVYRPSDTRDPSHWALFFTNPTHGDVILQVGDDKGGVGYYVDQPMHHKQPQKSGRHDKSIYMGEIDGAQHDAAILIVQGTPVDNGSTTWNCQSWAMEALDNLERYNMLVRSNDGKANAESLRQNWQ